MAINYFRHMHLRKLPSRSKHAFSLIEVSIVLVILGLLTGGILAGQSLIRGAELRSISTGFTKYTAAQNAFRDKYFALPGDMNNATAFWNAADSGDGVGSDCGQIESTDSKTCNGDGNAEIASTTANGVSEKMRYWQHLANAGLIEGSFAGGVAAGGNTSISKQIPAARISGTGYEIAGVGASGLAFFYDVTSGLLLKYGVPEVPNTNASVNNAALSPSESWNLDGKFDDGNPTKGKWLALDSANASGCVSNGITYSTGTTGTYLLNNLQTSCRVYFVMN